MSGKARRVILKEYRVRFRVGTEAFGIPRLTVGRVLNSLAPEKRRLPQIKYMPKL